MFRPDTFNGEQAHSIAEHFAELLALPALPNVLKLAENTYRKLRKDRADVRRLLEEESARMRANDTTRSAEFERLALEHSRLDEEIRAARAELDKRRASFVQKAREELAAPVAEYRIELERQLADLADLIAAGGRLARDSYNAGIDCPHGLIEAAPVLAEKVRSIRQAVLRA